MRTQRQINKDRKELQEQLPHARGGAAGKIVRQLVACTMDEVIMKMPTPDPYKIPHIFRNVDMTIPATKELTLYMWWVYRHHTEVLRYVHRESQQYNKHGGADNLSFARWKDKLEKDLCETWRDKYGG